MTTHITQYLKDTRGELRHVAWPTQSQTIIYTVIIVGISVFIALYLGLFDYIFTTSLAKGLQLIPQTSPITVTQSPVAPTPSTGSTGSPQATSTTVPTFNTNLHGTPRNIKN
jgi:preprotein translocase SecE subunit